MRLHVLDYMTRVFEFGTLIGGFDGALYGIHSC